MGCLSWHKDTNFKANHNRRQRKEIYADGCLSWHKDTNFKANHNDSTIKEYYDTDVCLGTKIRILKQITTQILTVSSTTVMFVLAQRYEF